MSDANIKWTTKYTKENPQPGWEKGPVYFGMPSLPCYNDLEKQYKEAVDRWINSMSYTNVIGAELNFMKEKYKNLEKHNFINPHLKFELGDDVYKFGGKYEGPGIIVGWTKLLDDNGYHLYNVRMKVAGGTGSFIHVFPENVLRHIYIK